MHEAWLRLASYRTEHELSEREYRALVVQVMRHVLTDHARGKRAARRDHECTPIDQEAEAAVAPGSEVVLEVGDALDALAQVDEQLADIVEMRFFADLSLAEIADQTQLSVRTVKRRWQLARAWLLHAMSPQGEA